MYKRTEHKKNRINGIIEIPRNKEYINKNIFDIILKQMEVDKNNNINIDSFDYLYMLIQNIRYDYTKELNSITIKAICDFLDICFQRTGDEKYFYFKYDILNDYIFLREKEIEFPEKKIQKYIVENFNNIFENISYIKDSYCINEENYIDILGEEIKTKRPVIIEIKKSNFDPNKQLIRYSKYFDNPILIAISEEPINLQLDNIKYYLIDYKFT